MNAMSGNKTDTGMPVVFQPDETLEMLDGMLTRALAGRTSAGWRDELWPALAELGLFTALLSGEDGGYGGARTAALGCRRLAEAGLVTPFALSAAAITRTLVRHGGLGAPGVALLRSLADGGKVATLALHEDDALPAILTPKARLAPAGDDGWKLTAAKRMIAFADEADRLLLPAATADGELALVLIELSSVAHALRHYILIDGTPAADLELADHPVSPDAILARGDRAAALIGEMCDALAAAQCSEAVGAMRAMIDATRDYLGVRKQFGQPLAVNQALRHRFVDMEIALAKADTMATIAAAAIDESDAGERARIVASARYVVLRAGWKVSQEAVQMHGAIGMANETPLGGYFKRILALALWFGDEDVALDRAAA